jgi:hypothetical protein
MIDLVPHALHLLLLVHIQPFYALDQVHAELELKNSMKQVQAEEFTNLVWIKTSLVHLTTFLKFCLSLYLIYDS